MRGREASVGQTLGRVDALLSDAAAKGLTPETAIAVAQVMALVALTETLLIVADICQVDICDTLVDIRW